MTVTVTIIEIKPLADLFNYLIQDASLTDPQPWREHRVLMQLVRDTLESYLIDAQEEWDDWDSNAKECFEIAIEAIVQSMGPFALTQLIHSVIPIDTKGTVVLVTQFSPPSVRSNSNA